MKRKSLLKRIGLFCIASVMCSFALSCKGKDKTYYDSSAKFNKICIEGHVYYQRTPPNVEYIAIKLDNYGNPIKCKK